MSLRSLLFRIVPRRLSLLVAFPFYYLVTVVVGRGETWTVQYNGRGRFTLYDPDDSEPDEDTIRTIAKTELLLSIIPAAYLTLAVYALEVFEVGIVVSLPVVLALAVATREIDEVEIEVNSSGETA